MRPGVESLVCRYAPWPIPSSVQLPHMRRSPLLVIIDPDPPQSQLWGGCTLGPGVVRLGLTAQAAGGGGAGGHQQQKVNPIRRCSSDLGLSSSSANAPAWVFAFVYVAAACTPRC
jgi:hypothetical protein